MVNIQFVDLLEPDIKPLYLHLFRDGRDVALSFMKAIVGEKHIYFIAKQWREEQEAAISLMENIDSKRFAQVRYENLLANPEREIKTICSFIGADYDPSVLSFFKSNESIIGQTSVMDVKGKSPKAYIEKESFDIAAEPVVQYMTKEQLQKALSKLRREMEKASKELDFIEASRLRDEMFALQKRIENS